MAYLSDVGTFLDTVISTILQQLTEIGAKGDMLSRKQQGTVALEFVNTLIAGLQLNAQSATLIVKLFQLAKKNDAVDPKFIKATFENIKMREGTWYQDVAKKLESL